MTTDHRSQVSGGEPVHAAKQPVSPVLAGPYGHPFHPMLVTVPIGAWVCSLVFDIGARLVHDPQPLVTGARWLIAVGVVSAVVAASVGLLDFFTIPAGTRARRVATVHMMLNLLVTVAFAADLAWRLAETTPTAPGPLLLSVVSIAALGVSGALGGKLAYHYGVRVAAEAVQAEGFRPLTGPDPSDRPTHPDRQGE